MARGKTFAAALAVALVALLVADAPAQPATAPGAASAVATPATAAAEWRFDFGPGAVAAGHQAVVSTTAYTHERGFGFVDASAIVCLDRGTADILTSDFCSSDRPFVFAVDLPEGNYAVTVTLGDPERESVTTVKAESRRLMLERVHAGAGAPVARTFVVNTRNSRLPGGGQVKLKPREIGAFHWDDQLTIEFSNARPAVAAVAIARVEVPTVFLAGDSTVTDQTADPYHAWGQMLTRFLGAGVAVANHAESGETLKAFEAEGRWAKLWSQARAGDYLFVQFAHNDMKAGPNYLDPATTYRTALERVVEEARSRGVTPVLVTSMHRRRFDGDGRIVETFGDFPAAVRAVARGTGAALIDLHEMSRTLFEAAGVEGSKRLLLHFPAGSLPGQAEALVDDTHFSAYGAYELARCMVEGIRANVPALARAISDDAGAFDPARPDPVATFTLPASPASVWPRTP